MRMIVRRLVYATLLACAGAVSSAHAGPVLWVEDGVGGLGKVDVATGAVTMVGNTGLTLTDIAFDPSGALYGISFGDLYRIDKTNAQATLIGALGTQLNSLVFGADGTLYGASNDLYKIDKATGATTAIGNGGASYASSGDLAFIDGSLYLSSLQPSGDSLIRFDASNTATVVGPMGVGAMYGMATNDGQTLYGVAGSGIYRINPLTGAATLQSNYNPDGLGPLGAGFGTTFYGEAVAAVPEPSTYAMLLAGIALAGVAARRKRG